MKWMHGKRSLPLSLVALLAAAGHPAAQAQSLFRDDFDALGQGAQVEGQWLPIGAQGKYWFADSKALNTGNLDSVPTPSYCLISTPDAGSWGDVRITATVQVQQPEGAFGLMVRAKDARNMYFMELETGNGLRKIHIKKLSKGVPLPVLSADLPAGTPRFESGTGRYKVAFQVLGNDLFAYLDGKLVLRATDTEFAGATGAAGLLGRATQVLFDDVEVTPADPADADALPVSALPADGPVWRLRFLSNLSEADATKQAADLGGYIDVEVLPFQGQYAIYIGKYATEAQARTEFQRLQDSDGLLLEAVEQVNPSRGTAPVATAAAGGSSDAGGSGWRVMAGSYTDIGEAQQSKADFESKGYYPVDIQTVGSEHRVLISFEFPTEAEARDFASSVEGVDAKVVRGDGAPSEIGSLAGSNNVTEEERRRVEKIVRDAQTGSAASEQELSELTADGRRLYDEVQRQRDLSQQTGTISREIDAAIKGGRFDDASRSLNRWKELNPDDPAISLVEQAIAAARDQARSSASTPAPRLDPVAQMEQLRRNALAAEEQRRTDDAIRLWRQIRQDASTKAGKDEADSNIARLEKAVISASEPSAAGGSSSSGPSMGLLLGIGGGVVLLGGVAAFLLFSRRKAAAPPPARPASTLGSSMAMMPAPPPTTPVNPAYTAVTPLPIAPPVASPPAAPAPASAPEVEPPVSLPTPLSLAGPSDRIRPGMVFPAIDLQNSAAASASTQGSSGAVPMLSAHPTPVPPSSETIRMEAADHPATPPSGEVRAPSSAEFATPPMPDTAPALFAGAAPAIVLPAGKQGEFYMQDFSQEELGKAPRQWKGSYDYASLTVVEREPGKRCMKFEKRSGAGSAYYSCRFPDASGRVAVEFDMRCDDKNKYLLGFYVEKDEDFRHSIHTVVHKDSSKGEKVSLRLQNEAVPYQLGQWVHVRFLVDLPRHMVDGYVDDKAVAVGIRLASRPKVINTLSIRDNLATEGVLMIANIRIYQDR